MHYDTYQSMDYLSCYLPEQKENNKRKIKCHLVNTQNVLEVLIDVESFLSYSIGENDIPWEIIPDNYLIELINENRKEIWLPFFSAECYFTEFGTESFSVNTARKLAFSREGIDFTLLGARGRFDIDSPPLAQDLSVPVSAGIYIGSTPTFTGVVQQMNEGDVIFIIQNDRFLRAGGYFQMTLMQEQDETVITGQGIVPENPVAAPETTVFDSRRIPVRVDFLQCRRVFPLSDLMALQPGDKIPLPQVDNHLITLEINGQRFAQGELVRIGEQYAVEIHHIFSKGE
ncbi:MAG: FliM/FliN family flagellar motor switch protein [Morganella sp. (in: enterobacteria)]